MKQCQTPCSPEGMKEDDGTSFKEHNLSLNEKFIVVESGRCSWAKCTYCSFSKKPADLIPKKTPQQIAFEIDRWLSKVQKGELDILKFFNSGSFLDPNQIPPEAQKYLIDKAISLGIKELLVESTNEWIKEEYLAQLKEWAGDKIQIAFGFGYETVDNDVRKKIRKIGTAEDYQNAAKLCKKYGFKTRFYTMVGLPFVKDHAKNLEETIKSVYEIADSYAVINTFPYGYSVMFDMYMKKEWAPLTVEEFNAIVLPVLKKVDTQKKCQLYADDYVTYPKFPEYRQSNFVGAKEENLENGYFYVWQDYLQRFYKVPAGKQYALFLPCAFRKPYSSSKTHRAIIERLQGLQKYSAIHQLMVSNPGVIPREFEGKWPFQNYDWPEWEETPELMEKYINVTKERLVAYLKSKEYTKVFCYFRPDAESFDALQLACKELKIPLITLMPTDLTGKDKEEFDLLARKNLDHMIRVLRANV
jgi:radical SAM enzyme (TIGR01210 family)